MQERGVALDALTTAENADDLETLRRALGTEQIRLLGGSYGSHLGLAALRRHPRLVQRMALASIEGPDHTLKLPSQIDAGLDALGVLLQADTFYARELPDLSGAVRMLLVRLSREPVRVTIDSQTVVVGAWDLRKHIADAMGSGPAMRQLPATLLALSRGDFSRLGRWALGYRLATGLSMMSVTMDCASHASPERLARIRRESATALVGGVIDFPFPDLCAGASLPRLPDEFRAPLHSTVPALFIAGTLDARTPEANAREIAATMPNASVLVIENGPHGTPGMPELLSAITAFLRGDRVEVNRLVLAPRPFVR
jgi:pimeloyl-ACP methyl ester carboxylesterase